jgi:hypothetical protein
MVLLLGGAAPSALAAAHPAAAPQPFSIPLDWQVIPVTAPAVPARFGFDQAKGRVEYAAERAGEVARLFLNPNSEDHPAWQWVGSLSDSVVVAPFAALFTGISASRKKLDPEQLSDAETRLIQAMTRAADQKHLREHYLKAAVETTRRQFVPLESVTAGKAHPELAGGLVETQVEELRLERLGSSDTSFALVIQARLRLRRAGDGAILSDESFRYQTGKALFLDWTLHGAFEDVAQTAYRKLAAQMVDKVFTAPPDKPLLAGTGYRKTPASPAATPSLAAQAPRLPAFVRLVSQSGPALGAFGIYSTSQVFRVLIQTPLTKDQAVAEAVRDTDYALDGLQDSRNAVVATLAAGVAVPLSLYKQTAGCIGGLTKKQHQAAVAQMSSAAQLDRPGEHLAQQVAAHLAPQTAHPVVVVNGPFTPGAWGVTAPAHAGAHPTLAGLTQPSRVSQDLLAAMPGTALEIRVVGARLTGKGVVNPSLALSVEAEATLWRVSDGQPVCSFPVHYRSAERKFAKWAAHDARLFRAELDQSYRELGRSMVGQLVAWGLVAPDRAPAANLVSSPKQTNEPW